MKRIFIFLTFLLAVVSCKKDEPVVVLTVLDENIELYAGQTYQIAPTGGSNFTYISDNNYVADVSSSGLVTANKVGRAKILVTSSAGSVPVYLKVEAKNNLYSEPITDWNLTKNEIISRLGTPQSVTESSISYTSSNPAIILYAYSFDILSKLKGSGVAVFSSYVDSLSEFLEERYKFYDSSGDIIMYINGNDYNSATIIVGVTVANDGSLLVAYVKRAGQKSNQDIKLKFMELFLVQDGKN